MSFVRLNIRWSAQIACYGADAPPIPSRGGVYEILFHDDTGVERMYVGQTEDLRRASRSWRAWRTCTCTTAATKSSAPRWPACS